MALPPRSTLERVRQAHSDRAALLPAQEKGQTVLDEQAAEVASTAAALHAAEEAAAEASKRLDEAQWEHRAHDLATTLVAGQPCPVCRQTVSVVPTEDDVADVDDARARKRRAEASVVAARQAHESADRHRATITMKLDSIADALAKSAELLREHPDPEPVDAALAEVDVAEAAERAARQATRLARQAVDKARAVVAQHDKAEKADRRAFDEARDRVAALGPPAANRVDLAANWIALADWAAAERPARHAVSEAATARAEAAVAERTGLQRSLAEQCDGAGVALTASQDVRSVVADALAGASAHLVRIDQALADKVVKSEEVAVHTRRADVAHELARLMSVRHFEKWVLDETLGRFGGRRDEPVV